MICGGIGDKQEANNMIQDLLNKHLNDVWNKIGSSIGNLKAIDYRTQIVAGTNYYITATTEDGKKVKVVIYEKLPCYDSVTSLTEASFE